MTTRVEPASKHGADVLTLRKAFVNPVVRPELVGAVGVRVEAADCREQARLRGWRHRDAVRARGRAERVQRVVELLLPFRVTGETLVHDGWVALAGEVPRNLQIYQKTARTCRATST